MLDIPTRADASISSPPGVMSLQRLRALECSLAALLRSCRAVYYTSYQPDMDEAGTGGFNSPVVQSPLHSRTNSSSFPSRFGGIGMSPLPPRRENLHLPLSGEEELDIPVRVKDIREKRRQAFREDYDISYSWPPYIYARIFLRQHNWLWVCLHLGWAMLLSILMIVVCGKRRYADYPIQLRFAWT